MSETEKSQERFNFNHLPETVAANFRDTLSCYKGGLMYAFMAMCRQSMQAVFDDLGEGNRLKLFDQVEEIIGLANADERIARAVRRTLFDADSKDLHYPGGVDREVAGILLEILKEILYQNYTRRTVLQQKLRMRRFFANQSEQDDISKDQPDPKISPLKRPTGTD